MLINWIQETSFFKLNKAFIKSLRLLYRASEHNFDLKAFHKLCDGIPHTLAIVKTETYRIASIDHYLPALVHNSDRCPFGTPQVKEAQPSAVA